MAYNLQRTTTAFSSGKNILASEHVQFVEAGVTLKGGVAYGVGELLAKLNGAQGADAGKWVKFVNADVATKYEGDYGILNVDVANTTADSIVGEVIVRGSVYEAKLPTNADLATFKAKVPMIRFVKHI